MLRENTFGLKKLYWDGKTTLNIAKGEGKSEKVYIYEMDYSFINDDFNSDRGNFKSQIYCSA